MIMWLSSHNCPATVHSSKVEGRESQGKKIYSSSPAGIPYSGKIWQFRVKAAKLKHRQYGNRASAGSAQCWYRHIKKLPILTTFRQIFRLSVHEVCVVDTESKACDNPASMYTRQRGSSQGRIDAWKTILMYSFSQLYTLVLFLLTELVKDLTLKCSVCLIMHYVLNEEL